jgi:hypothetical protein
MDCFRLRQGFGGHVASLAMTMWMDVAPRNDDADGLGFSQ